MKDKDLQRFRATLAEVENATNICPECDNITEEIEIHTPALIVADFGAVAATLPCRYCRHCDSYIYF